MPDTSAPGVRAVYLHPGQLFAADSPTVYSTILGSCASVCLWDPARAIGGMNHFLLPVAGPAEARSTRFAEPAVNQLIERVLSLGARRGSLQAKLFGGACVLEAFVGRDHLGLKNVDAARRALAEHAVPLVAENVGGRRGRKVVFHTVDGVVHVRLV